MRKFKLVYAVILVSLFMGCQKQVESVKLNKEIQGISSDAVVPVIQSGTTGWSANYETPCTPTEMVYFTGTVHWEVRDVVTEGNTLSMATVRIINVSGVGQTSGDTYRLMNNGQLLISYNNPEISTDPQKYVFRHTDTWRWVRQGDGKIAETTLLTTLTVNANGELVNFTSVPLQTVCL